MEDSILCARFLTRAGRNSFLIEVTYNYVNACWTWRGVNVGEIVMADRVAGYVLPACVAT